MAQRKEFCISRTFSSPSPVVNPEVSVQWTRDGRGEVLISLKVPQDIVDAELFMKTTKGHFGILMDLWSSSIWRKYWSQWHTPNKITKEKIWCLRQVKAERRISLHRTAGQTSLTKRLTWKTAPPQYNPRAEGLLDQNDPWPKGAGKIQRKLNKVRFESRPRKRQRPMPQENEETDPQIVISSEWGWTEGTRGRAHRRRRPPQSPPEEARKEIYPTHTPQSHPPYPPPEDDDWETEKSPRIGHPRWRPRHHDNPGKEIPQSASWPGCW